MDSNSMITTLVADAIAHGGRLYQLKDLIEAEWLRQRKIARPEKTPAQKALTAAKSRATRSANKKYEAECKARGDAYRKLRADNREALKRVCTPEDWKTFTDREWNSGCGGYQESANTIFRQALGEQKAMDLLTEAGLSRDSSDF